MAEKQQFRTMIGGQALIEGIMMRGPQKSAIVVRKPDGEFATKERENKLIKERYPVLGLPLIRGTVTFFESMKDGISALTYSAEFIPEEEAEEPSKFDKWIEEKLGNERAEKIAMGIALVIGILLPVGLFILLPTLIAGLLDGITGSGIVRNLIEGAIRIAIFLGYLFLVSRMKDIKRVFMYHGAEHKTISCYEAGEELIVENVRKFSKHHPRCGTSFLFVVMVVSIIVFSVVSWSNPVIRVVLRLALLPVVVGISYEFNRLVGRYDNPVTKFLRAPGMWLQRLTTSEPDDSMMEVAIEALKMVLPEEKGADRW